MIGLDEARRAVLEEVGKSWQPQDGELMIDDDCIWENDEVYTLDYGAREWIIGKDFNYGRVGYGVAVVSKADGSVSFHLGGPPPVSDFDEKFSDLRRVEP